MEALEDVATIVGLTVNVIRYVTVPVVSDVPGVTYPPWLVSYYNKVCYSVIRRTTRVIYGNSCVCTRYANDTCRSIVRCNTSVSLTKCYTEGSCTA